MRWRAAAGWSHRHDVWLIGGLLTAHTVFMMPGSPTAVVTGAVTIIVEVALLTVLARRVAGREDPADRASGRAG